MSKRRFIDFDSMFKENERKPILAKIKGEEFLFPAEMPAKVMFKIQRMNEQGVSGEEEMTSEQTLSMFSDLLGRENLQRILDLNASMDQLQMILAGVMEQYGQQETENEGVEEPKKEQAAEVVQIANPTEKTEFRL